DISIIICTFNRYVKLKKVLNYINELIVPDELKYEVIIVDNNSNDKTKGIVERFIKKKPQIFKYLFEQKQGKSYALNSGIKNAHGEIIAFTDDDVRIDRKWLFVIMDAFKRYDCIGVGGKILPMACPVTN
ncbi:unnamed protein product, partial [marine sediment metagenome]